MSDENDKPDDKPGDEENEVSETDLYDALSEGIDEVSDTPTEKKDDDESDDKSGADDAGSDADGDDTPAPGDSGDGEPDGPEGSGDEKDPKSGSETDEDGADDDVAAGEGEGGDDPASKAGETGDEPGEGDESVGELDPINDPIPESTNKKTAERIQSLIGIAKTNDGAVEQRDEILERITTTGADAEQYAATLGFLQLYNSDDKEQRKQALEAARGVVRELSLELGEGASVVDLANHDDLRAEVEAGTLTETRAIEIAATREQKVLQDARTTETNRRTDEASTTQANIETGKSQLDKLHKTLLASDTSYEKLYPTFLSLLRPALKRAHPTEWGEVAQEVYQQVKSLKLTATTPKPKPKPKNTPLRPKGDTAGGGAATEVDDAVDAVSAAIDSM